MQIAAETEFRHVCLRRKEGQIERDFAFCVNPEREILEPRHFRDALQDIRKLGARDFLPIWVCIGWERSRRIRKHQIQRKALLIQRKRGVISHSRHNHHSSNNLTPEAKAQGESLVKEGAKVYVVDDAELKRVKEGYPCVWKDLSAAPKLCFLGCPHMTLEQMIDWTKKIERGLKENGRTQVTVPTVFTASTGVIKQFNQTVYAGRLAKTGVVVSFICPLMFMDNPTWQNEPVITSSNKLRTYTTARFYDNDEILSIITGEGK